MANNLLGLGVGGGGGSASTFVPSSYGTVAAWWDFTNTSKVINAAAGTAINNDPIDTLTDSGANSFNFKQTTGANRPVLKTGVLNTTYQAALFTGASSHWMQLQNPNPFSQNYSGLSFVFLAKSNTLAAQQCLFTSYSSGFNAGSRVYFNWNGTGIMTFEGKRVDADAASNRNTTNSSVTTATWYVLQVSLDPNANTAAFYVNGTQVFASTTSYYATTGNFENVTCPGGALGALPGGSAWFMDGYIAMGVAYSQTLSSTDATNIYNACHTQYGI